jgi:hypothetical protein
VNGNETEIDMHRLGCATPTFYTLEVEILEMEQCCGSYDKWHQDFLNINLKKNNDSCILLANSYFI